MDYVQFGQTPFQVSRLSIGTGTHGWAGSSQQTGLGLDGLARLLRKAHDLGINFWDTASQYGSHPHVAQAMRGLPRDSVVIATKTTARNGRQARRAVERFLRELDTDVLDIVLLHFLTTSNWPRQRAAAMDALSEAKEKGLIRAVGVSCHDLGALSAAAESDWVDVVLARINYAGVNMDASPEAVVPVLDRLHQAGKAVYGMKVLGCGNIAQDPRRAIQYVLSLGTVYSMTIGMNTESELEQNVRLVKELAPLYPLGVIHA